MKKKKELTQREMALQGGLAVKKKYGRAHFVKMGKESGKKKAEKVINTPVEKPAGQTASS